MLGVQEVYMAAALVLTVLIFVTYLAIESERSRRMAARHSEAEQEYRNRQLDLDKQKLELDAEFRRAALQDRAEERALSEKQRADQMDMYRRQFEAPETQPAAEPAFPRVGMERANDLFGPG
jgi:flagellar biosynthesis/type III secretory pathway M-ring protein FliF/YscJ